MSVLDIDALKIRNPEYYRIFTRIFKGTDRVESFDTAELKIGGVAISKSAAEINALNDESWDYILQEGTPVNAVAASGTLTISDVALDAETVTIGDDTYEFAADADQSVESGNIAVDITSYATASEGTLTVDTQPIAGDTMTIGTTEYTFVPDSTANAEGEISIGANLTEAQANIVAAVNGTDGFNTAHSLVTIGDFEADDAVITAIIAGTDGDTIATTETFDAGTNIFDDVNLGATAAGVDCSAANAVTALVDASSSATEAVTLSDGDGDTVDVEADTAGVVGNAIATTETMSNAAFGAENLENGVDGTVGSQWETYVDADYLYVAVAENTTADDNWRRISLGSAY